MIRQFFINLQERRYHSMHKKAALKTLNNIERYKGKTNPQFIELSDRYAEDVLGWVGYAPWLYVYSAFQGEFKEGWIPDNFYGKRVVPKLKGDYGKVSDLKALTNSLFNSNFFPDRYYYVNGLWLTNENKIIPGHEVSEALEKSGKNFIFKDDNSSRGRGILILKHESLKADLDRIKQKGNGVIQSFINQHSFFDDIMPNSVATLRFTTMIVDNGDVSLRACYMRVGRQKDTHIQPGTYIRTAINLKTGELDANSYTPDWQIIKKHPDTGFIFENKTIPHFDKCIKAVFELHKKIPYSRIIGWDLIVDKNDQVQIMEWNGNHNDIKFTEATQGPIFKGQGLEKLK